MIARRTADSFVSALLIVIGVAQFWGGFTMDRLEIRHIHPASIPGLVPMFLGAAIAITALIVFVGSRRTAHSDVEADFSRSELGSVAWVAGLCALYALVLVGRLHFWAASAIFVFAFIILSEWQSLANATMQKRGLTLGLTFAVAIGVTGGIAYLFEEGFLVRLP